MQIAPLAVINFGFYNSYINLAIDTDLVTALENSWKEVNQVLSNLSEEQLSMRYEPGKWSIKEIAMHLVDAERTFCYRIMRFSRQDQTPLPGIDMHQFVVNSHAAGHSIKSILAELELLRNATIIMFREMHPSMLDLTGPVRDAQVSVRALGFAMAGHYRHHLSVIKERYLSMSAEV